MPQRVLACEFIGENRTPEKHKLPARQFAGDQLLRANTEAMSHLVEETSILTSHVKIVSDSLRTARLTGSIHFNIGTFRFKNGETEFYLKNAEVVLEVSGCRISNAAYIQNFDETFEGDFVSKTSEHNEKSMGAAAGAVGGISNAGTSLSGSARAESKVQVGSGRETSTCVKESASGERIVFSYEGQGGRWFFTGRSVRIRGRSIVGLIGTHLQRGEGPVASLATLVPSNTRWKVAAKLVFQPKDVEWWSFSSSNSTLSTILSLLFEKKDPRAFLTRAAIGKWMSKRASEHPFFEGVIGGPGQ